MFAVAQKFIAQLRDRWSTVGPAVQLLIAAFIILILALSFLMGPAIAGEKTDIFGIGPGQEEAQVLAALDHLSDQLINYNKPAHLYDSGEFHFKNGAIFSIVFTKYLHTNKVQHVRYTYCTYDSNETVIATLNEAYGLPEGALNPQELKEPSYNTNAEGMTVPLLRPLLHPIMTNLNEHATLILKWLGAGLGANGSCGDLSDAPYLDKDKIGKTIQLIITDESLYNEDKAAGNAKIEHKYTTPKF